MTEKEFYQSVEAMPAAQRAYFKTRSKHWLQDSKTLEKKVDQAIKVYFDNQIKIDF